MRSPHTIEIQFVFNNINIAGPLISKMPDAYALADKTSSAWVAFARTGDPNTPKLPRWPAYSAMSRDTMLFNNDMPGRAGSGSRPASGHGAGAEVDVSQKARPRVLSA